MVADNVGTPPTTLAAVIPAVFGTARRAKARVQLYNDGFDDSGNAYVTIQVKDFVIDSTTVSFESISRSAFHGNAAVRTALETLLQVSSMARKSLRRIRIGSRLTVPVIISPLMAKRMAILN